MALAVLFTAASALLHFLPVYLIQPAKDETEEERMVRMEMEALAAEEKARTQAVSSSLARQLTSQTRQQADLSASKRLSVGLHRPEPTITEW